MTYDEWEKSVPQTLRDDTLWRMKVYRLALFLGDIAWADVSKLSNDRRTRALSDQLYRAIGSISANLAEGYSRGSGKDRARFLEYSLGSARETREWYYKARHLLDEAVVTHRLDIATQIIRLLLTMLPEQRQTYLREEPSEYTTAQPSNDNISD